MLSDNIAACKTQKILYYAGSFAPFHDGHIDTIISADKFFNLAFGGGVIVIAPHSDHRVAKKIGSRKWTIDKRIGSILTHSFMTKSRVFIDDISADKLQNTHTIDNIEKLCETYGFLADNFIILIGSDGVHNLTKYLSNNHKVICVMRPGYQLDARLRAKDHGLFIIDRKNRIKDISSTEIRNKTRAARG